MLGQPLGDLVAAGGHRVDGPDEVADQLAVEAARPPVCDPAHQAVEPVPTCPALARRRSRTAEPLTVERDHVLIVVDGREGIGSIGGTGEHGRRGLVRVAAQFGKGSCTIGPTSPFRPGHAERTMSHSG